MSNELPYEVYDCDNNLAGAFPHDGFAEAFVEALDRQDARRPLEIVGPGERGEATDDGVPTPPDYDPDDVAFGDEVDVARWFRVPPEIVGPGERPTIDAPVELTCHTVEFCEHYDGRFSMRCLGLDGDTLKIDRVGAGYMRLVRSARINIRNTQKDAPAPQRTVRDLRPGEVVILDGRWSICTKAFALVDLLDGAARNPRGDTPIDKVYRLEPEDQ